MGIKRYTSNKDTTITNAFEEDLKTRAVSASMGAADSLEVFSIYGQVSQSSGVLYEQSRILLDFPISEISTDRSNKDLPKSGSVDFYLKLYNVVHPSSLPKQFYLEASPISRSWREGLGMDMEGYVHKDSANWISASTGEAGRWRNQGGDYLTGTAQVIKVTCSADTSNSLQGKYFQLYDGTDTLHHVWFDHGNAGTSDPAPSDSTGIEVTGAATDSTAAVVAQKVSDALNANGKFEAQVRGRIVRIKNMVRGATTAGPSAGNTGFTVNRDTWGIDNPTRTAYFDEGTEDLELNITNMVEDWLTGSSGKKYENYGVLLHLSSSLLNETRSYYTKKFSARTSQYFYKRPIIEARWDSARKDSRGKVRYSSSLAPQLDNLNTLYFYNYIGGQLKNIPGIETPGSKIYVRIFSGSNAPSGSSLDLVTTTAGVALNSPQYITGGWADTGIYSASFAIDKRTWHTSSFSGTLYDVWGNGTTPLISAANKVEYYTGSFTIKSHGGQGYNITPSYVTKITNLRDKYSIKENPKFRVFTRKRDWCPTVYNVATKKAISEIVEDCYFKVKRIADDLEVISFGTGSSNKDYTRLSYDISGNYFDLDMSMFEPGYMYGINLAFYIDGVYKEQPETFKFRIEE